MSINLNSSVNNVVDFLEEKGLGDLKEKLQECEVDGDTFINMDLVDLNELTPKLKFRRILRQSWTEVTGMEFSADGRKVSQTQLNSSSKRKSSEVGSESSKRRVISLFNSEDGNVGNTTTLKCEDVPIYWLEKFEIPSKWEPIVQAALDSGELTVENKNALNRQLCTSLYACTDKITKSEREHVAIKLITKYPFLKGCIGSGHSFWAKKIKDRFENLNKKKSKELKKAYYQQEGKEVPKGKPGRKKSVRLTSVIPAIPDGETEETYDMQKKRINDQWKKSKKDYTLVKNLMNSTYPMRRREIITKNLRVWEVLQAFPPFGSSKGTAIRAELGRILQEPDINKDIKERFMGGWRERILCRMRKSPNPCLKEIMEMAEGVEFLDEKEVQNRCIMAGLPVLIFENKKDSKGSSESFWLRIKSEDENSVLDDLITSTKSPRLLSTGNLTDIDELCLAAEGMVICQFRPPNILNAVVTLLGSYYVFNMEFPKGAGGVEKALYLFLEHILIGQSSENLPLKVENLISDLLL